MAFFQLQTLTKKFDGLAALDHLSFEIIEGEIFGVVGPNGSGKTTLVNVITGFLRPTTGNVIFKEESIEGLRPYQIAKRGIIRTFQLTSLFPSLTALENICSARYLKTRHSDLGSFARSILLSKEYRNEEKKLEKEAEEILSIMEMTDQRNVIAENLPTVDQRKLEIAIALAAEPEFLLLDEPAAGMNPEEVNRIMGVIQHLQQRGITLVVIEHNMRVITGICNRVMVISYGTKIAEGTPEEVVNNEKVIASYLGEKLQDA
jgi:branched-chain amino acid transport system ATP-binding protein